MDRPPEVTVIFPTRNEEESIGKCIADAKQVLGKNGVTSEIIVADYSKDRTPEIARKAGATVIPLDRPGYGHAYLVAFKRARGRIIVLADADSSYQMGEVPRLLQPIRKGKADLVIGSRLAGSVEDGAMPALHRYVGNPLLSGALNLFFGTNLSDTHSGFRAIRRDRLEELDLKLGGMEFASELIIKARRAGLRIAEVPITYRKRKGESKLSSFTDGWRHLRILLLYSPTYLFLIPGTLLFFLGITVLTAMSLGSVQIGGQVLDTHSMVLASMAAIVGFQVAVMGLFTKTYAASEKLEPESGAVKMLFRHFHLETALWIGTAIAIAGFLLSFSVVYKWLVTGFGPLDNVKRILFASTLLVIGIQTIFSAFFLSILVIEKKA